MKLGDFTELAKDYSTSRPDYSLSVLRALLGHINLPKDTIQVVDVGAGTGIWTRMVSDIGIKNITAIEPNNQMLKHGAAHPNNNNINWLHGNAENTTLESEKYDWVTMASSFHWANFDVAIGEFARILKPNGKFTALWNPRFLKNSPILMEIESKLSEIKPNISRVSSGNSSFTTNLTERLETHAKFKNVVYIEGKHRISMSPERYISAWKSVNDLQSQLGSDGFSEFLQFVTEKVIDLDKIEADYITRSWTVTKC